MKNKTGACRYGGHPFLLYRKLLCNSYKEKIVHLQNRLDKTVHILYICIYTVHIRREI